MDAHFNEYLAAVAGMIDIYGAPDECESADRHAVEPMESFVGTAQ